MFVIIHYMITTKQNTNYGLGPKFKILEHFCIGPPIQIFKKKTHISLFFTLYTKQSRKNHHKIIYYVIAALYTKITKEFRNRRH